MSRNMIHHPGPALSLLWEAARARGRPEAGQRVRDACRLVEAWSEVAPLARRHGLSPLVHDGLAGAATGELPAEALAELSRAAEVDRRRAFAMAMELGALAGRCAAAEMAMMPLKGPLLSARLFGDLAARQVRDLDLLVRPGDGARAQALLVKEGYVPRSGSEVYVPWSKLCRSAWQREALQHVMYHVEYYHPERQVHLELHWGLSLWSAAEVDALWAASREGKVSGAPIRELDDEHLLVLLCGHGSSHLWFRLKWLVDVAALFDRLAPERVESALETAARLRRDRAVAQARLLCSWLDGAPAPAYPQKELGVVWKLADRAKLALAGPASRAPSIRESIGLIPYHARSARQSLPRFLWQRTLVRPADWQTLRLPVGMLWAYRPLRPALLAWREVKRARRARRGAEGIS
jgi:hypothetical protein